MFNVSSFLFAMNFLTELREGLGISWSAIRANKLRSILTTLGIVIGIVTVTLMGTAIEGLNTAFMNNISTIGADVFYVERFNWFGGSENDWRKMQKRPKITLAQEQSLARQITLSRAVAPVAYSEESVKYQKRGSDNVQIIGTTDDYVFTSSVAVGQGRFLSSGEVDGARPVCVIGSEVATNLFRDAPAVGSRIRIDDKPFEVIGVLERQGSFLGLFSLDNQVIVPLPLFTQFFWRNPDYQIQVKVKSPDLMEDAKEELRVTMRKVRQLTPQDPDNFGINQQDIFVQKFQKLGGTIAAVGLFVTGLSLFVGGIGIMNIMFVSVAERTREIGIRKAIGAKRRTILVQFLLEAACICLIGGLIALGIAWPITWLMQIYMPATLSVTVVSIALSVSLITGLASGFFPAWRAARMNPVDALRNE